jgi:hypothetical protein
MGRSGAQQGSRFLPMSGKDQADGSLRVVYAASIRSCRPCLLREQCQWNGSETRKPRQVSVLLHPLSVGGAPLRLRETGVGEFIDGPTCNWCGINVWRFTCSPVWLPFQKPCPCLFPGLCAHILGSRGRRAWLAMHAERPLTTSRSSSSGFPTTSRASLRLAADEGPHDLITGRRGG